MKVYHVDDADSHERVRGEFRRLTQNEQIVKNFPLRIGSQERYVTVPESGAWLCWCVFGAFFVVFI